MTADEFELRIGPGGVHEIVEASANGGALPAGGTTGEVLTKASNADGDADWEALAQPTLAAGFYQPPGITDSVNPNTDWLFQWDHIAESVLLDLTDPYEPTLLTAGTYSFVVQVWNAGLTQAGKLLGARLELDAANEDFQVVRNAPLGPAVIGPQNGEVGMAPTMYLAAGSALKLTVAHNAVGALDMTFLAIIQKLT